MRSRPDVRLRQLHLPNRRSAWRMGDAAGAAGIADTGLSIKRATQPLTCSAGGTSPWLQRPYWLPMITSNKAAVRAARAAGGRRRCANHRCQWSHRRYSLPPRKRRTQRRKKVVDWQPADNSFAVADVPLRDREDPGGIFFEKNWANYLTGTIYKASFRRSVGS